MKLQTRAWEQGLKTGVYYLRTRAGLGPPYIHFAFMGSWRSVPDSYLQILP